MEYVLPYHQESYVSHNAIRFTGLIKNVRSSTEAFARRLCHSSEETKDLMQDATVVAWRYFPQLNDESQFGALMFQIVKQQYLYRKRSKERHKPYIGELPEKESPAEEKNEWVLLESNLDLYESLTALKGEERELVLLKWAGFTLDELAQIYSCKLSCMNMRLRRAKEHMKKYLVGGIRTQKFGIASCDDIIDETTRLTQWAELKLAESGGCKDLRTKNGTMTAIAELG
jgi:RNA polymerase sigma-70 factor (ECF subfamily)